MGAFNWILVDGICPNCESPQRFWCQTHIASDCGGDHRGRFHDREYRLGEEMWWWPRTHPCFMDWRDEGARLTGDPAVGEEACYATCPKCGQELCVVVQFRENVPERVVQVTRESDWPKGYAR